jgi:RNA polymerase sigma-70 factor (ECF subfamily)
MLEHLTDEELMGRFQTGDMRAFELLLARHQRGVFGFILRFAHNRATAEELLQDVFLRVVDKAQGFEQRSRFSTWLYTIARNLCIDHLRKMQHRKTSSLDQALGSDPEGGMTLMDRVGDEAPGPDQAAHSRRLRGHIQQAIGQLSPEQREVFLLREEAGLQFDEIARIVEAPINTVKSRMRYALQNLKGSLEAMGVEP